MLSDWKKIGSIATAWHSTTVDQFYNTMLLTDCLKKLRQNFCGWHDLAHDTLVLIYKSIFKSSTVLLGQYT